MTTFIDLKRCFNTLTSEELGDPEYLAYLNERKYGGNTSWQELLEHPRVLLVAEAGSGKTIEMKEQTKRLVNEGKFAFFIPLETLAKDQLADVLSPSEEVLFKRWINQKEEIAWFFLDSVDELKLTAETLDRALRHFFSATKSHIDYLHTIISSRPNDWQPTVDRETYLKWLPLPSKKQSPEITPEEAFLAPIQCSEVTPKSLDTDKDLKTGVPLQAFIFLPLSNAQIALFAQELNINNPTELLAEIEKQNAWLFARRPLDLTSLINAWETNGVLGTRSHQHEANIQSKLKDDPERPDSSGLSDAEARLGAERLALALALTRTRTIRSPEQTLEISRSEGVLDPAEILSDWTEDKRKALLRRALFDPATYGRIRFHHRSVQEYLAAKHLEHLREKGMSNKALFRLLFAEKYGVKVVLPSMRPIAAWLALSDVITRQELINREPEALLIHGDPQSLEISARAALIQRFVTCYGTGSWRGLDIPLDEVRRLAAPELASVIRVSWGDTPINPDVGDLLLDMIWQGPIPACADLAYAAAMDQTRSSHNRVTAIKALLACGKTDQVGDVIKAMLSDPIAWPSDIARYLLVDFFPEHITVDELISLLIQQSKSPQNSHEWVLLELINSIDPRADHSQELRNKLARLLWSGRHETNEVFYKLRSEFESLSPVLAKLCQHQIQAQMPVDAELIHASIIASRFSKEENNLHYEVAKLRAHFSQEGAHRETTFWLELDFIDELVKPADDWKRFFQTEHNGLIGNLSEIDRPWITMALTDKSRPQRQTVALHGLFGLWQRNGAHETELLEIETKLGANGLLHAIFKERAANHKINFERECIQHERDAAQLQQRSRAEEESLSDWRKWREELLLDPDTAFTCENQLATLNSLNTWLTLRDAKHNRLYSWNRSAISAAFNQDIAERVDSALKNYWRNNPASPLSICGLSLEALTPNWAEKLSKEEARIAIDNWDVELNGFAPYLADITRSHPDIVQEIIGSKINIAFNNCNKNNHIHTLQKLRNLSTDTKKLLAPLLQQKLTLWPKSTDNSSPYWLLHLKDVVDVLIEVTDGQDRQTIALICQERFETEPATHVALIWLQGLFRINPEQGSQSLEVTLSPIIGRPEAKLGVTIFAGLFGSRNTGLLEIADPTKRAQCLGKLVRLAYAFIRREDDQIHESGSFTPNTRDDAETARNFLLNLLLETPGPDAFRIINELAVEADFGHFSDRLLILARQRAANDAEFSAYPVKAIQEMEKRIEIRPHDRDGLFEVMIDRLEDLAHELAHHDFSDRRTLRTITEEAEMQRTLARRLMDKSNGAYLVARENEVADLKKTDIQLSAVTGKQKATIEIKLASRGRWVLTDFRIARKNQLLGQYLRHENCKAGCLLLTYDGTKKYWVDPDTKKQLSFKDLCSYLNKMAKDLEIENNHNIRLHVFGLDLTDPTLAPAHRLSKKVDPIDHNSPQSH